MKCLFFLLLILLLISCRQNERVVPVSPLVLGKEKMIAVLVDIHIAESAVKLKADSGHVEKSFHKILSKHSVTKEQYEESLKFYVDNPEILNEIYENVLNEISRMQGEASQSK